MTALTRFVVLETLFFVISIACFSQTILSGNSIAWADSSRTMPPSFSQKIVSQKLEAAGLRAYTGSTNCEDYTFSFQTGDAANAEKITAVRSLPDGNYMLAGTVKTGAEQAGLLIRLDKSGTITWTNKYAQAGYETIFKTLQITPDDGWIVGGISKQVANGQTYVLVIKFSATGVQEWSRQFMYSGVNAASANSNVLLQDDSSYAFSAHSGTDILLGALNKDGSTKWIRQLNFGGDQYYTVGIAGSYDGIYGTVATMNAGKHISYICKLDRTNGNTIWSLQLGSAASGQEYIFQDMEEVNLRPRICGLFRKTAASPWEFSRMTINTTGFVENVDYFGLPATPDTTSFSGTTPWAEYLGVSLSAGSNDLYLIKAIPDLYYKNYWCHKITQPVSFTVSAIERSFDGGVIIVGNSSLNNGDIFVTKTDSAGFLQCPSEDIAYTHTYDNTPLYTKNTFVNNVYNPATGNAALSPASTTLQPGFFCKQLYCAPLPDSTCVTTFYNTYRDYYFSEIAYSMVESADGNLVLGGGSRDLPYDATTRGFITILNKSGRVLSAKNVDYDERGIVVNLLSLKDKSIITGGQGRTGSIYANVFSRFDKTLNLQWEKSYYDASTYFDMAVDDADNLYYGSTNGKYFSEQQLIMTKLDVSGNVVWRNIYSYANKSILILGPGKICINKDLLFTSTTVNLNNRTYTLLSCINTSDGSYKWSRLLDAPGIGEVRNNSQLFIQNNLLYLSGYIDVSGGYPGSTLIEMDLNGNILQNKRFYSGQKQFGMLYTANPDGTFFGLGAGYDYGVTPAVPIRIFLKLDAGLNVMISRINVSQPGAFSRNVISSTDGFLYELGTDLPEEPYNADFYIRKMEPDGKTGNCLTDSLAFNIASYTLSSTAAGGNAAKESIVPVQVVRREAERRITLNTQRCVSKSVCDTLFLTGPAKFCDTALFSITTHRSPGCTAGVSWMIDTNFVRVISRTDTGVQLRFRKSGNTVIKAMLSNGCRIFSDSLELKANILPDSISLGPDIGLCPNNNVTLHAPKNFASYIWQDGATDSIYLVTQPGLYYVTASTLCGNQLSDTLLVTTTAPPFVDLGPDVNYCAKDTLRLKAPAGFIKYSWYNVVTGDSLFGQSINAQPTVNTIFYLLAEKTPGCFGRDTIEVNVFYADAIQLGKDSSFCQGDSLVLHAGNNFNFYKWSTGSTAETITVLNAGTYWVNATTTQGCSSKDTLKVPSVYSNPQVNLDKNPAICKGELRLLVAGSISNNVYAWNDGSNKPGLTVTTIGDYWVTVTDVHNCRSSDTVHIVTELTPPHGYLPPDTAICAYQQVVLHPTTSFTSYSWSSGATTEAVTITQPGQYTLLVKDQAGCTGKDTVIVSLKECTKGIFFPTAFSPNGDAKNEVFRPRVYGQLDGYLLQVYNRFGQLVFSTTDYLKGWDGKILGKIQDTGGYPWICNWQFKNEKSESRKGIAILLK